MLIATILHSDVVEVVSSLVVGLVGWGEVELVAD